MNGYECGSCGCDPCICAERRREERIRNGKEVLETFWQALVKLPKWKRSIIIWLWPDMVEVVDELRKYYWADRREVV